MSTQDRSPARKKLMLLAISLAATSVVPWIAPSRFADFGNGFLDHLQHTSQTWVFLHRGLDVYREPFAESAKSVATRHPAVWFGETPPVYPPGMFALFLPPTLAGEWIPMSAHTFAALTVLYLLLVAHLALFAIWSALEALAPGDRLLVGLTSWLIVVQFTLLGFYDAVILGAGAMAIRALAGKRPARALVWMGVGALLHYRTVILVPIGVVALREALRGKRPREWPLRELAFTLVAGVVSVGSFGLMYASTAPYRASSEDFARTQVAFLGPGVPGFWLVVGLGIVGVAALAALRERLGAALVAMGATLAIVHGYWWWHGMVLVLPALAVGAARPVLRAASARVVALAWMACTWCAAYGNGSLDYFLFAHIARYWTPSAVWQGEHQGEPWLNK